MFEDFRPSKSIETSSQTWSSRSGTWVKSTHNSALPRLFPSSFLRDDPQFFLRTESRKNHLVPEELRSIPTNFLAAFTTNKMTRLLSNSMSPMGGFFFETSLTANRWVSSHQQEIPLFCTPKLHGSGPKNSLAFNFNLVLSILASARFQSVPKISRNQSFRRNIGHEPVSLEWFCIRKHPFFFASQKVSPYSGEYRSLGELGPHAIFLEHFFTQTGKCGESFPVLLDHLEVHFGSESCIKSTYQFRKAAQAIILRGAQWTMIKSPRKQPTYHGCLDRSKHCLEKLAFSFSRKIQSLFCVEYVPTGRPLNSP